MSLRHARRRRRSGHATHGHPGVDDDGTLYFFSQRSSNKNAAIARDKTVHLMCADSGKSAYLAVVGDAAVRDDRQKVAELWSIFAKTWFPGGPEDPELTLIVVTPRAGHYWDTQHNKMVQLAGIALGALTGKMTDDGREGELKLPR